MRKGLWPFIEGEDKMPKEKKKHIGLGRSEISGPFD